MSWHYQSPDGQEHEIDESQFAGLVARGDIREDTMVWTAGMGEWQSARMIAPDFFAVTVNEPVRVEAAPSPPNEQAESNKPNIPALIPVVLIIPIAIISGGGVIPWGIAGGAIGGAIAIAKSKKLSVGMRILANVGIAFAAWVLFVGAAYLVNPEGFKRGFEKGYESTRGEQPPKRGDGEKAKLKQPPKPKREGHLDVAPDLSQVPVGVYATDLVGGKGGGSSVFTNGSNPLLGIDYKSRDWDRRDLVPTKIEGIVDRSLEPSRKDSIRVVAKEGYAVTGLEVEFSGAVYAVRLYFSKLAADGTVDLADTYDSGWIGTTIEGSQQVFWKSEAKPMLGITTNAGMITDAIGGLFHADDTVTRSLDGSQPEVVHSPQ